MSLFSLNLYRNIIPLKFRIKISILIFNLKKNILKLKILNYYRNNISIVNDKEISEAVKFLKHNPINVFPSNFQNKYKLEDIVIFHDYSLGLKFVIHNEKKLYFKRSWDESTIKYYYLSLLIEQDINSPHLYLTNTFNVDKDSIFVDVGAAEGIISLNVIDYVSKIFLFEVNTEWIEALNATFSKWPEKVIIINKYASNNSSGNSISLDDYFKDKILPNFIKIDVDGAESIVLEGSKKILENSNLLKIALCTYHKQNDAVTFSQLFSKLGFSIEFSKGLMLFFCDSTNLVPPYFVKGVLRASKIKSI